MFAGDGKGGSTAETLCASMPAPFFPSMRSKRRFPLYLFLAFVAAALTLGAAFLLDDTVIAWIASHRIKSLRDLAGEISDYGDWPPTCGVILLALGWAIFKKDRRWIAIFVLMIYTSIIAGIAGNTLRSLAGRTRPNAKVPQGWYGLRMDGKWIFSKNQFHAFPSGHSAAIAGLLLPLAVYSRRMRIPALAGIVLVGCSRMYVNAHHLSDVIGGYLVGAASLAAAQRWLLLPGPGTEGQLRLIWPKRLRE